MTLISRQQKEETNACYGVLRDIIARATFAGAGRLRIVPLEFSGLMIKLIYDNGSGSNSMPEVTDWLPVRDAAQLVHFMQRMHDVHKDAEWERKTTPTTREIRRAREMSTALTKAAAFKSSSKKVR